MPRETVAAAVLRDPDRPGHAAPVRDAAAARPHRVGARDAGADRRLPRDADRQGRPGAVSERPAHDPDRAAAPAAGGGGMKAAISKVVGSALAQRILERTGPGRARAL